MLPGKEETRAVLVEEIGALEETDHLVAEELFGGGRIDVRYADPLAGGGPATAGDERVDVGMGVELVPERLGHRDHTGTKALLLAGRHGHQLADGLPGHGDESAERAEELPVVHEVGAKHLRGGELGRALGAAGGTEPPPFAGKREKKLGSAAGTADAGEASLEDAAVEVPSDDPVQDGAPEAVAGLEEILPGPLDGLEEGLE